MAAIQCKEDVALMQEGVLVLVLVLVAHAMDENDGELACRSHTMGATPLFIF